MNDYQERYQRQLILDGFGPSAQAKLASAKVLVIGAGGLGCPILQYLAAAGVGTIGIADNDIVSATNLNRQVLYTENDLGQPKVFVAEQKLGAQNSGIKIISFKERWNTQLSVDHFPDFDIIVDATDNFASRYLINDACVLLNKPLVFGAVSKYEGQVALLNVGNQEERINYRDLFPEPPRNNEVQSCSEAGVIGFVPGIIGTIQAAETVKLITGIGRPLIHQLLLYNALRQETHTISLSKNPASDQFIPKTIGEFILVDYEWLCASEQVNEISIDEWLLNKTQYQLVDIREPFEKPRLDRFDHRSIPLSHLSQQIDQLSGSSIVFVCQSGVRSKSALNLVKGLPGQFLSLSGGVNELVKRKIV